MPTGWVRLSPKVSAALTERLLAEQKRMALLTQGLLTVVARNEAKNALLVQCDPTGRNFYVTHLTGATQNFLSSKMVSVSTVAELAEALQPS